MENHEQREPSMAELSERAQTESNILLNDAKAGDWLEVSASELGVKMHLAKEALTGANIDEITGRFVEAEKLYLAAKEKDEVPKDLIDRIDKMFESLKHH